MAAKRIRRRRIAEQRVVLNEFELASRWGIAVSTLRKWRQIGGGPAYLKLRARVVYPLDVINTFEQQHLRSST